MIRLITLSHSFILLGDCDEQGRKFKCENLNIRPRMTYISYFDVFLLLLLVYLNILSVYTHQGRYSSKNAYLLF